MSRAPEGSSSATASDVADHLRLLVESQPDYAIFLLDETGHVVTWNGGARRLKGYQADEIVGRHFSVFYPAEQVAAGVPEQILEAARATGRHEAEGWRVRKDGTEFWADVVITALRDERGELVGFGKVTRDLTSRQLATEQLRAAAAELRVANAELEQFRLLITSVRDYAIFILDVSGHIRTWNAGAENIKGYAAEEVIGRHFELFYTEQARARRHPAYELEVAIARRPLRGGRLARTQGRHAVLGQRRHHRPARRARRAGGVRQGHARPDRAPAGAAALEESERLARAEAERQRRRSAALERVSRAIVAELDLDEILQTATDAATDLTGADPRRVRAELHGHGHRAQRRHQQRSARCEHEVRPSRCRKASAGTQLSRAAHHAGRRRGRGRPVLRAPGRRRVRRARPRRPRRASRPRRRSRSPTPGC